MKYKILVLIIALMSIYGCKETTQNKNMVKRITEVSFVMVEKSPLEINKEFKAKVEAHMLAEIRPQVTGIITSKEFNDGDYVKKGQLLYKIEDLNYKAIYNQSLASLNSIKADLENAKIKHERYSLLLKQNAISIQEKEEVEFNYKKLKATLEEKISSLEIAKINLDYTSIRSPIEGFIGISTITKGSLVTANQSDNINTVTSLNPIYLDINQTTNEFAEMKENSKKYGDGKILVTLSDFSYDKVGVVVSNNVSVDSKTNTIKVRSNIENKDNILLPGMYVNTVLKYGVDKDGLIIPQKSVSFNSKGNPYVYIVENEGDKSFVVIREIKIGLSFESNWIVKEGLNEGDKVVYEGFDKIKSKDEVKAEKYIKEVI